MSDLAPYINMCINIYTKILYFLSCIDKNFKNKGRNKHSAKRFKTYKNHSGFLLCFVDFFLSLVEQFFNITFNKKKNLVVAL